MFGPVLASVQETENMVEEAIGDFTDEGRGGKRVMVVLDGIDFMMAALGLEAERMLDLIGRIREVGFLLLISSCTILLRF